MKRHPVGARGFEAILPVVLAVVFSGPVRAMDGNGEAAMARGAAQADVTPTAPVQGSEPSLTLESGEDGAFLTGKLGFERSRERKRFQFLVKLRAPFDKKTQDEVGFLNLDGLTGGTTGAVSLTWEFVG